MTRLCQLFAEFIGKISRCFFIFCTNVPLFSYKNSDVLYKFSDFLYKDWETFQDVFLKTSAWILLNMAYTGKWLVSNSVDFRWNYVIFGVCFVCFVITDCQNVRRLWKKKKFSFWHAICFNYGVMLRYYRVNLNKNK